MIKKQSSPVKLAKPASQIVNDLGKYMYKSLDGSYRMNKSGNMFDLYTVAYYQIPQLSARPGGETTYSDMYEMSFNINFTTYSNKIRVNIIELSPDEQTVGHFVVDSSKLQEMKPAKDYVMNKIYKILNKYFEGYAFIF